MLTLINLGIDTYKEAVVYMREDCPVCRSEGFEVHARVKVTNGEKSILATLNTIEGNILSKGEASLSKTAWQLLDAKIGDSIILSHPNPLDSLSAVRSKVYGHKLQRAEIKNIISDIAKGYYSDIHIATFLTACVGGKLSIEEVIELTQAMIDVGTRLNWGKDQIVDKHCVGGIPGNRTSLIVVPIVAAFGLTIPKTSSRAITSPAGTADTMEVFAPVNLDLKLMRKIVEQENACIAWGGAVSLSPADDILIRVERVIDLDSEGQLVASVLSKKIAAGSSHILIDIPVGETAKVRTLEMAETLKRFFDSVANALNVHVSTHFSDGSQPVGRGIGPALEAFDILDVLQNKKEAPQNLRNHALDLAGHVLNFSPQIKKGEGRKIAEEILTSGKAWKKFQDICQAQGGMTEPTLAKYTHPILADRTGQIKKINNRLLAHLAKFAGAPHDKSAGIKLHTPLEEKVEKGQPLFTLYAESKGELNYTLSLLKDLSEIILIEEN